MFGKLAVKVEEEVREHTNRRSAREEFAEEEVSFRSGDWS